MKKVINVVLAILAVASTITNAGADQVILKGLDGANLWANPTGAATVTVAPVAADGPANMVYPTSEAGAWHLFVPDPAVTKMTIDEGAAKIDMPTVGQDAWRYQINQQRIPLVEGRSYTLTFRAKASLDRPMAIVAQIVEGDWHGVGLSETPALTSAWQSFKYTFTATKVTDNTMLVFMFGHKPGTVWIGDIVLKPTDAQAAFPLPATATRVDLLQPVSGIFDVQLSSPFLPITDGSTYRIAFKAKADTLRPANVTLRITQPDWHSVGKFDGNFTLGPSWRTYAFTLKSDKSAGATNVLAFGLGPAKGSIWIADATVTKLD
ncbi:MAG TPA: carbohydrate binding domain-containing protein [Capsulimonadaceae bacterium]|jgi:hypothetical protein